MEFKLKKVKIWFLMMFLVSPLFSKGQDGSKPNIVWISTEDISPAWGCYDDKNATTPNIDSLAENGYVFTKAFSNAPICSPARSTLISGIYATTLGTQNLRSKVDLPSEYVSLPEVMKQNGYFTSNNYKTDYNFDEEGRWDDLGREAHWRNNVDKKPFFSVFNFMGTHEGPTNQPDPVQTQTLPTKHDPNEMSVPPYFPQNAEFKNIMAHQYDLITVFDQYVGKIIENLKKDQLFDNTIIFIFSDHGYGLPRYKRWLYNSGLQIPFVLHVPEKYKGLTQHYDKGDVDKNISFVDFAPTVLKCAGVALPKMMQGQPFLGDLTVPNEYSFGYRDRADDVYDMSRSVFDGRYIYIRNFMPHLPYIQKALIFGDQKWAYRELHKQKKQGNLSEETMKMFFPKAMEELYDLKQDPYELNNLIENPELKDRLTALRNQLRGHMVATYDTGLMNEGRMMLMAKSTSVYEVSRNPDVFNPSRAFEAADLVGRTTSDSEIKELLNSKDPNVRFWGLNCIQNHASKNNSFEDDLINLLQRDPSMPNRYLAAEILVNRLGRTKEPLDLYRNEIEHQDFEPMLLQLSISIRNIGEHANPLVPWLKEKLYPRISGEVWGKYKDWYYNMFIGFAIDQTFINCKEL